MGEKMTDLGGEMKELITKGVEEAIEKAMEAMHQSLADWVMESQTMAKKKGKNYAGPSKLAAENDEGGREIEVGGERTQAKETYAEVSKLLPEMPALQVFDENSERIFVQKAPTSISQGTNPIICSTNPYWNALKTHCNMVMVYKLHENEYGKFDSKIENRTPETHWVGRSLSPGIAPVSSRNSLVEDQTGRNSLNHSSSMTELADVAASLSGLSLSKHDLDPLQTQLAHRFDKQSGKQSNLSNGYGQSFPQAKEVSRAEKLALATNYVDLLKENGFMKNLNAVKLGLNDQANFPRRTSSSANLQSKWNSSGIANFENPNMRYLAENYPHPDFHGHLQSGYFTDQELKAVVNNQLNAAATLSNTGMGRKLRSGNQAGFDLNSLVMDPRYIQYLQQSLDRAMHAASLSVPSRLGNASGPFGRGDLQSLQKAYLATLVAQQKQQYDMGKAALLNHQYYVNPSFGPMPYQGNLIQNTVLSFGPKGPMLQDDRISSYASMMQNQMGGSSGSWHPETGINVERSFAASLLEEIKNNKSSSFELLDVVDHVVDFSKDQYSGRFIQQKLETATEEEKMKIFSEIFPHARSLITDVFGNYVIQKFFEHGTESERNELANQLIGHVLPLSLQIYGCRVIQKALEVVDVDQQTKLLPLSSYIGESGVPEMAVLGSARFIFNVSFVDNSDEEYLVDYLRNASVISRMIVNETTGTLQRITWHEGDHKWLDFYSAPKDVCDQFSHCGPYGVCNIYNVGEYECKCPPGNKPKVPRDWYLRDGSQGCVRIQEGQICGNGEGFVKLTRMKLPDTSKAMRDMNLGMKSCADLCLRNCSCMGYSAADVRNGGSKGCITWYSNLVDLREFSSGGQDFYMRLDAIELAKYSKKSKRFPAFLKILFIVLLSAAILVLLSFAYCLQMKRIKAKAHDYCGLFSQLGEIRNFALLRLRFQFLASALQCNLMSDDQPMPLKDTFINEYGSWREHWEFCGESMFGFRASCGNKFTSFDLEDKVVLWERGNAMD